MLNEYDIIVIGAGLAGCTAAQILEQSGRSVLVLEARSRAGGRIVTDYSQGVPIDLGASWVHGIEDNPVYQRLTELGVSSVETAPEDIALFNAFGKPFTSTQSALLSQTLDRLMTSIYDYEITDLPPNASLQQAALRACEIQKIDDPYFARWLTYRLSDYEAEDAYRVAYSDSNYEESNSAHHFITGGFDRIIRAMAEPLTIFYDEPVIEVCRKSEGLEVITTKARYFASQVISTLPLGVLKAQPEILGDVISEQKQHAIRRAGFGVLNKFVLEFEGSDWPQVKNKIWFEILPEKNSQFSFFLNLEPVTGKPILMGFASGDFARLLESAQSVEAESQILRSLEKMFGSLPPVKHFHMTRWSADPYARGSYSYLPVGQSESIFKELARPEPPLYFAGEATQPECYATVHGAYFSGLRVATLVSGSMLSILAYKNRLFDGFPS